MGHSNWTVARLWLRTDSSTKHCSESSNRFLREVTWSRCRICAVSEDSHVIATVGFLLTRLIRCSRCGRYCQPDRISLLPTLVCPDNERPCLDHQIDRWCCLPP